MASVVKVFRCPCCGQYAPIERLDEAPFKIEGLKAVPGGKRPRSEAEKLDRSYKKISHQGSAMGRVELTKIAVSPATIEKIKDRIKILAKIYQ